MSQMIEGVKALAEGRWSASLAGFRRYGYLVAGAAFYGSAIPAGKLAADGLPILPAACLRLLIAALLLAPFAWRERRDLAALDRRLLFRLTGAGLLGLYGFSLLLFFGLGMTSGIVGSICRSASPASTAVASCLVLGEGLGWRRLAAIGAGGPRHPHHPPRRRGRRRRGEPDGPRHGPARRRHRLRVVLHRDRQVGDRPGPAGRVDVHLRRRGPGRRPAGGGRAGPGRRLARGRHRGAGRRSAGWAWSSAAARSSGSTASPGSPAPPPPASRA